MSMPRSLKIFWIAGFIKVLLGIFLPLSFDETYYWVWSHHLHLSYFDHPGMISWLFYLGHFLEPFKNSVRLPTLILGHLSLGIWLLILDHLKFSEEKKSWWMLLACTSPFLGVGTLIALPDVPLLFFTSAAYLFFLRALEHKKNLDFLLCGLSLGLGFSSKYHLGLFAISLLIYLLASKRWKELSFRQVGLCLLFSLFGSAPVWIWNFQNHWQSFAFQIQHGLGGGSWQPDWTFGYLGGEIALLFPVTIYFIFRKTALTNLGTSLLYVAGFPFLFFFLTSFRGVVELNWPITAYPAAYALAINSASSFKPFRFQVLLWMGLASFIISHIFFPFLKEPTDKLNEVHYFDPLRPFVKTHAPLYLGSYQMASVMTYENKKLFRKLPEISRHDFYDEEFPQQPQEKHFFLIKELWVQIPEWLDDESFQIKKIQNIPPKFELLEVSKK